MLLKDRLKAEMISAMKNKQKDQLAILRVVLNTIKNFEIDNKMSASDDQVIKLLKKQIKQSQETQQELQAAGRLEQLSVETAQIEMLQQYLPAEPSPEEIAAVVDQTLLDFPETTIKDLGTVIKAVRPNLPSGSDMKYVTDYIKAKLS